eukprot:s2633_g12.t1
MAAWDGVSRSQWALARSQRALPDLKRELQISVGTAGPQPKAPDLSWHCRTLDLNRKLQTSEISVGVISVHPGRELQISVGFKRELQISVTTGGPQPRAPVGTEQISVAVADPNRELQISVGIAGPLSDNDVAFAWAASQPPFVVVEGVRPVTVVNTRVTAECWVGKVVDWLEDEVLESDDEVLEP